MAMNDKLVNELLELRKYSKRKGMMYIIIPDEQKEIKGRTVTSISIARPKTIFKAEELDDFIKFMTSEAEFAGKIEYGEEHPVWERLIVNSKGRWYYKFLLSDARIELCPIPLNAVIPSDKISPVEIT